MAPPPISPPPPTDPSRPAGLTPSQLSDFADNGYLCIDNALDPGTIQALLQETHRLLADFDPTTHPMTKFETGSSSDAAPATNDNAHVGDAYFLTSGDKIRHFLEPDAVSRASPPKLLRPPHLSVNKIGHALHSLSPPFARASINGRNAAVARSLGFSDPRVLQSMVILKQPQIGGAVPPHQDSTFLYTDPPSAVGFWYALEDATAGNGGLSFARGSHRRSGVERRFVRRREGGGTGFEEVEGARFPAGFGGGGRVGGAGRGEEYETVEVKAGSLVLIHGNVLHKSEKNLSGKSRFIYTFHVIEGENEYDGRNWLQPSSPEGFSKL